MRVGTWVKLHGVSCNGAEIDLIVESPGLGLLAIEVKKGPSAKPRRGFYSACEDLRPAHKFLVHSAADAQAFPVSDGVTAVGLRDLAQQMAAGR